jgi:DNA-binding transcriptional regulator YdaS (Cro superfamily)
MDASGPILPQAGTGVKDGVANRPDGPASRTVGDLERSEVKPALPWKGRLRLCREC